MAHLLARISNLWAPNRVFKVKVAFNGRHPYRVGHELDYKSFTKTVSVRARSFDHAELVAFDFVGNLNGTDFGEWWSVSVISIKH